MKQEPGFAECNGLDWFVALWELWKAKKCEGEDGKTREKNQEGKFPDTADISGPLVLDALCKPWTAKEREGDDGKTGEKGQQGKLPGTADIIGPLVLDALCKLLNATPGELVTPLLPQIRNFILAIDYGSSVVLRNRTLARLEGLKYGRFSCRLRLD